jgi:hypothetical protein
MEAANSQQRPGQEGRGASVSDYVVRMAGLAALPNADAVEMLEEAK